VGVRKKRRTNREIKKVKKKGKGDCSMEVGPLQFAVTKGGGKGRSTHHQSLGNGVKKYDFFAVMRGKGVFFDSDFGCGFPGGDKASSVEVMDGKRDR